MEVRINAEGPVSPCPAVVTIGKFDGIHRGHRALIERAVRKSASFSEAGAETKSIVYAINMSPVMLLSARERCDILSRLGVDFLVEQTLTPEFIRTEAESFLAGTIREQLRAVHVIAGEDFRFGYARRGDDGLLARCGKRLGFTTETVPDIYADGEKISSSRVREAVLAGDMEKARELLGYEFFVTGEIIHGRQLGRTIGVPTANLITEQSKLLPPNGVYATESVIGDRVYRGITNVGTKPTVDGHFIGVETYFFDCGEDLYGEELRVKLLHFVRPERKFGSLEELKEQIRRDETAARGYFGAKR